MNIRETHSNFAEGLSELYNLYLTAFRVNQAKHLGVIFPHGEGWEPPREYVFSESPEPLWVDEVKFPQLIDLESRRTHLTEEIDQLSEFTPLLYAQHDTLEIAVASALSRLGLQCSRTGPGANIDLTAHTPDMSFRFGLEITGVKGYISKDSKKIAQIGQFFITKDADEKAVVIVNTHCDLPIRDRHNQPNFTEHALTVFKLNQVALLTTWNLYQMVYDVITDSRSNREIIELIASTVGELLYDPVCPLIQ